jgi:hypothetical protein
MVHVADRAHVDVRLGPLEFSFCHFHSPKSNARVRFNVCITLLDPSPRAAKVV